MGSVGSRKAAAIASGSIVPSGRYWSDRCWPTMTAWPAASSMTVWGSGRRSSPGRARGAPAGRRGCPSSRRDEQAGLLAEQLGGALLELDDRRVVAEDVVADLGSAIARRIPASAARRCRIAGRSVAWAARIGGVAPPPRRCGRGARPDALLSSALAATDPWCSGPTCQPVTLEIAGSNPVGSAILRFTYAPSARPDGASFFPSCSRWRSGGVWHNRAGERIPLALSARPWRVRRGDRRRGSALPLARPTGGGRRVPGARVASAPRRPPVPFLGEPRRRPDASPSPASLADRRLASPDRAGRAVPRGAEARVGTRSGPPSGGPARARTALELVEVEADAILAGLQASARRVQRLILAPD